MEDTLRTLEADLIRDEGLAYTPYKDTKGNWTIGVGHLIGPHLYGPYRGADWSPQKVAGQLRKDILEHNKVLYEALPWAATQPPFVRRVLENMAFNLGVTKLLGFTNTLAFIKDGKYRQAASNMRKSLWAKQVGARAERLAVMMETGVIPEK